MEYTMKAGCLYPATSKNMLARIKSAIVGPVKKIYCDNDVPTLTADICNIDTGKEHLGDVRNREYLLIDNDDHIIAVGNPGYAPEDDPDIMGWPVCRMPRVDHAVLSIRNQSFLLTMHNSQNYSLCDKDRRKVLQIMHKGLSGGWHIVDDCGFSPEILCGLFSFCRYIEQENEFLIV